MIQTTIPGGKRNFVHKRLLRAGAGFLGGGFAGAARGFLSTSSRAPARRAIPSFRAPGIRKLPTRSLTTRRIPQRPGIIQTLLPALSSRGPIRSAATPAAGNGCPQGFHPNKSDYYTRAGFVAEGSKCVRNRRRNLSNGRANTKALRRMAAWDKQERKLGKTMKAIARGR